MKNLKFFKKFAAVALGFVMTLGVGAAGYAGKVNETKAEAAYTLTCAKNTSASSYGTMYDKAYSGITWSAPGNQTLGEFWAIGNNKATTNGTRDVYNKTAISPDNAISKITMTHDGIHLGSSSKFTINSIVLKVASDSNFSTVLDTVTLSSPSCSSAGSLVFNPSTGITSWPKSSYYKFTFDYTLSNAKGSYLMLKSISFEKAAVAQKYKVTYSEEGADSGSGPVDSTEYTSGSTVTVSSSQGTLLKSGYDFVGWSKTQGGQKIDSFTITENTTLYSVWQQQTAKYTVTLHDGDNTSNYGSYSILTSAPALPSVWERDTATFDHWSTSSTQDVPATYNVALTGPVDLYAVFKNTYVVTLNPGKGSGTATPLTGRYATIDEAPACPTSFSLAGKEFNHWSTTNPVGDGGLDTPAEYPINLSANTTLYAIWKKPAANPYFEIIESVDEIETDEYVIAAKVSDKYYGFPNASLSGKPSGTEIIVDSEGKITSATSSFVLTITKDNDNYFISNGSKYLGYSSSTNFAESDSEYAWLFSSGSYGTFKAIASSTVDTSTVRALVYRAGGNDVFGAYAQGNPNGTEYFNIEIFKKVTPPSGYEVTYDSASTEVDAPASARCEEGERFQLPAALEWDENHTFKDWFDGTTGYSANAWYTMPDEDVTFTARWDVTVEWEVTFVLNGGLLPEDTDNPQIVGDGTTVIKPGDPTKDGYTFINWYSDSTLQSEYDFSTTINADRSIYAKWAKNVTVIYHPGNGGANTTENVLEGELLAKPTDPEREGYTFKGWFTEQTFTNEWSFSSDTAGNSNFDLYAKWELKEIYEKYTGDLVAGDYVIAYKNSSNVVYVLGNSVSSGRITNGTTPTITNNKIDTPSLSIVWTIAKSGDYWTIKNNAGYLVATASENKADISNTASDDYALWSSTNDEGAYNFINKARYSDSTSKAFLRQNGTYGWASYGSGTGGALTLYKKVLPKYTVSFDNGIAPDTIAVPENISNVELGSTIASPTTNNPPAWEKHTFLGWFAGDSDTPWDFSSDTVQGDTTLVAHWDDQVTVTFTKGTEETVGNMPNPSIVYYDKGSVISDPGVTPTRDHYTFDGWYNGDNKWNFSTGTISTNITLTAHWVAKLVVTFNPGAAGANATGMPSPLQVEYDSGAFINKPSDPSWTKHEFAGWFVGDTDTEWNFTDEITSSMTLKAHWNTLYNVTYNGNGATGGSVIDNTDYKAGGMFTVKENGFTWADHVFDGWKDSNGNSYTVGEEYPVSGNITLIAQWTETVTYEVSFNVQGHGNAPVTQNVRQGGHAEEPADPTATGYIFGGWYDNSQCSGDPFDFETAINAPIELFAKWNAKQFSIVYYDQGGSSFSGTHSSGYPTTHTFGEATSLGSATKADYNFGGWFITNDCSGSAITQLGAEQFSEGTTINLYAKWYLDIFEDLNEVTSTIGLAYRSTTSAQTKATQETTVEETISQLASKNSWEVSSGSTINGLYLDFNLDNVISVAASGEANCGSIWGTSPDNDYRLYQNKGGAMTINAASGYNIKTITFTYSVSNTGTFVYNDAAIKSNTAVQVNSSSATFTVGNSTSATNGQVKITKISVTYEKVAPAKTYEFRMNLKFKGFETFANEHAAFAYDYGLEVCYMGRTCYYSVKNKKVSESGKTDISLNYSGSAENGYFTLKLGDVVANEANAKVVFSIRAYVQDEAGNKYYSTSTASASVQSWIAYYHENMPTQEVEDLYAIFGPVEQGE